MFCAHRFCCFSYTDFSNVSWGLMASICCSIAEASEQLIPVPFLLSVLFAQEYSSQCPELAMWQEDSHHPLFAIVPLCMHESQPAVSRNRYGYYLHGILFARFQRLDLKIYFASFLVRLARSSVFSAVPPQEAKISAGISK